MAMYGQISLSWMLHIPVEPNSRPIEELLAECKSVERFAYVRHEPWGMRPHYHLYLKLSDPLAFKYNKEKFNPLLAHPGDRESDAIMYLLKDSAPRDVVTNFSIKKYLPKEGDSV